MQRAQKHLVRIGLLAVPIIALNCGREFNNCAETYTPINALTVSAGTYWLAATFNANANSYEVASPGTSYRYVSGAYPTFPTNFPASSLVSNTNLNFYARAQDQP